MTCFIAAPRIVATLYYYVSPARYAHVCMYTVIIVLCFTIPPFILYHDHIAILVTLFLCNDYAYIDWATQLNSSWYSYSNNINCDVGRAFAVNNIYIIRPMKIPRNSILCEMAVYYVYNSGCRLIPLTLLDVYISRLRGIPTRVEMNLIVWSWRALLQCALLYMNCAYDLVECCNIASRRLCI